MTLVLTTLILYYRYLFVITGLLIFFISYFLAKENVLSPVSARETKASVVK